MTSREPTSPRRPPPQEVGNDVIRAKPAGVVIVLVVFVVFVLGIVGAFWWLWTGIFTEVADMSQAFAQPFEDRGYTRVEAQVLNVRKDVDEPTLYLTQILDLGATHDADVAVIGQMLTVSGTVNGDIDFLGQQVNIKRGAVVTGDIRCAGAEKVSIRGRVDGKIFGAYGTLDDQRKPPKAGADDAEDGNVMEEE